MMRDHGLCAIGALFFELTACGAGSNWVTVSYTKNNDFDSVKDPHVFYSGDKTAQIVATGNQYDNTTGNLQSGQGSAFKPPYPYKLDSAAELE